MPLSEGDKLGPYEILAPIGAGGMGEVYKARDAKLGRDVAIKVLPAGLSSEPDRLARFEREAKMLASLNHPNIATIYSLEESPDGKGIAMELVYGATLSTPLPLPTALDYARQVAEALEAAHDKGITHRDLKPANIMVTPAGLVKVLDFGLAAVARPADAGEEDSPTLTMGMTEAGLIMGTAAYMAPEQAVGHPVDRRADIWAFGVVLWQMLSGKPLFRGDTTAHTLANVINSRIDFTQLPATTPEPIRELLHRCLDRDVKTRLQAIGEARIVIQRYLANPAPTTPPPARQSSGPRLGWIAAGVCALATLALGAMLWSRSKPAVPQHMVHLDVELGEDLSLANITGGSGIAISPDGTRIAYLASRADGVQRLFTRRLDQAKSLELSGVQDAVVPFFSPDGNWIGFTTQQKLFKISVEGGAAVPLAQPGGTTGDSWGPDGNIIHGVLLQGLFRIPASGGAPQPLTHMEPGERVHHGPQVLPGGKNVLFMTGKTGVNVLSLSDGKSKAIGLTGQSAYYVYGHLLFLTGNTMFAVPFDLDRLEMTGEPLPLLGDILVSPITGEAQYAISDTGTLIYRKTHGNGDTVLSWVDASGRREPLRAKPARIARARVSPDGSRVALFGDGELFAYDLQRDVKVRLAAARNQYDVAPMDWAPDGRGIVFGSPDGKLLWVRASGGEPQTVSETTGQYGPSVSPDGKHLVFTQAGGSVLSSLWSASLETGGEAPKAAKAQLFSVDVGGNALTTSPTFSPDGHWLAFATGAGNRSLVLVTAFPSQRGVTGDSPSWQISRGAGSNPRWSKAGHQIYYLSGDSIMVVNYSTKGNEFVAEPPRVWLEKTGSALDFDVAPDGKRLLLVTPAGTPGNGTGDHQIVYMENFFDELRRRVPSGK